MCVSGRSGWSSPQLARGDHPLLGVLPDVWWSPQKRDPVKGDFEQFAWRSRWLVVAGGVVRCCRASRVSGRLGWWSPAICSGGSVVREGRGSTSLRTEVTEIIQHFFAWSSCTCTPLAPPNATLTVLKVPKHPLKCLRASSAILEWLSIDFCDLCRRRCLRRRRRRQRPGLRQ